jgi:hypothetical protein
LILVSSPLVRSIGRPPWAFLLPGEALRPAALFLPVARRSSPIVTAWAAIVPVKRPFFAARSLTALVTVPIVVSRGSLELLAAGGALIDAAASLIVRHPLITLRTLGPVGAALRIRAVIAVSGVPVAVGVVPDRAAGVIAPGIAALGAGTGAVIPRFAGRAILTNGPVARPLTAIEPLVLGWVLAAVVLRAFPPVLPALAGRLVAITLGDVPALFIPGLPEIALRIEATDAPFLLVRLIGARATVVTPHRAVVTPHRAILAPGRAVRPLIRLSEAILTRARLAGARNRRPRSGITRAGGEARRPVRLLACLRALALRADLARPARGRFFLAQVHVDRFEEGLFLAGGQIAPVAHG